MQFKIMKRIPTKNLKELQIKINNKQMYWIAHYI